MTRTYLRGNLARAMYDRIQQEESLKTFNKSNWYACDLTTVPADVASKFIQFSFDKDTENFVQESEKKTELIFLQIYHILARTLLGIFFTQTSVNGMLGRGSMFVFSSSQFEQLTGLGPIVLGMERSLLDLGAGDGGVTSMMDPYFSEIYATEVSEPMQRTLKGRGYRVLGIDEWANTNMKYDLISVLNLLDRCAKPITLLKEVKKSLKPGGGLLIALVWPFRPYVEVGGINNRPLEDMPLDNTTLESQAADLFRLLESLDFEVTRWSRVPYLCEGDFYQAYYWLTDVIVYARLKV